MQSDTDKNTILGNAISEKPFLNASNNASNKAASPTKTALEAVKREAKRLQKHLVSSTKSEALPLVRRIKAAELLPNASLAVLLAERERFQRKHFLRLLAHEAGFENWEAYHAALEGKSLEEVPFLQVSSSQMNTCKWSYPNLWFSTLEEAEAYVLTHGGEAIAYRGQAVVLAS